MSETAERHIVMSTPGFPVSCDDADKPFLLNHARALVEAGFRVTIVCPALPGLSGRNEVEGVEVVRVRYAPKRLETLAATGSMYREARGVKSLLVLPMLLAMTIAMIRELRRSSAIAYGHWWIPGGLVAVVSGLIVGRSKVVHVHGSDAHLASRGFMRRLGRWVLRKSDRRLAVSSHLVQWGREISSLDMQVLPMPVPLDHYSEITQAPEDGFVLAVGRLVDEKGFDVLIDAVAEMEESRRPEVVILGVGPERQALVDRAAKAEVALRMPGTVAPNAMSEWYRGARLVAVPSRREGFGLVAVEALAAGRAVVVSDVGAISPIVRDRECGLVVAPNDVNALYGALEAIDLSWGLKGREAVTEFGMGKHAQYLQQMYDDLV